jgi:hypothetical protein
MAVDRSRPVHAIAQVRLVGFMVACHRVRAFAEPGAWRTARRLCSRRRRRSLVIATTPCLPENALWPANRSAGLGLLERQARGTYAFAMARRPDEFPAVAEVAPIPKINQQTVHEDQPADGPDNGSTEASCQRCASLSAGFGSGGQTSSCSWSGGTTAARTDAIWEGEVPPPTHRRRIATAARTGPSPE